ncbi:MAG: hypothetical protein KBT34_10775 [Prevotella sp.]|nr:hypothetical protein [Candidatus Prevotella equi]
MEEYEHGIPLKDVFTAYYECRKNKRRTNSQLTFELNLEENVINLWREINERTYEIGTSICFCITRPKLREVFAADFRDRVVHHVIMQRLEPLFEEEFIEDTYNCRKGKGVLYGVDRLNDKLNAITENYTKDAYIAKFDICGFFMAIDKTILLPRLITFVEERYEGEDKELLLWLIEKVVAHKPQENCERHGDLRLWDRLAPNKSLFSCGENKGLPIGNLTSQNFGNFYLNEFDHIMIKEFGKGYGRYVDDFFVISKDKEKILQFVPTIRNYLENELRLKLHHDKVYVQEVRHGVKFIGSVIKQGRKYVGNRTIDNIYKTIRYYNKRINQGNAIPFMQTLNSYLGFMIHSKSYARRMEVIKSIDEEWWQYMVLDKNKTKVNII